MVNIHDIEDLRKLDGVVVEQLLEDGIPINDLANEIQRIAVANGLLSTDWAWQDWVNLLETMGLVLAIGGILVILTPGVPSLTATLLFAGGATTEGLAMVIRFAAGDITPGLLRTLRCCSLTGLRLRPLAVCSKVCSKRASLR